MKYIIFSDDVQFEKKFIKKNFEKVKTLHILFFFICPHVQKILIAQNNGVIF